MPEHGRRGTKIPSVRTISRISPIAFCPFASCPIWHRCFSTSLGTKISDEAALPEMAAREGARGCDSGGSAAAHSSFMDSYVPK